MKLMSIRDPLYGFVSIDDAERRIIDCEIFQRLRHVKHLSYTYLVYPSAVHTRFEHSIGAMHVAGLMATQLNLSPEDTRLVRLMLLLHDVGHGPLSHTFELVLAELGKPVSHERIGHTLLAGNEPLRNALGDQFDPLVDVYEKHGISPVRQILSSGLDADKLDYFRRDSHHTGVEYGRFDFPRIIQCLRSGDGYICLSDKALHAVEGFRLARLQLHAQVYMHHARAAAEAMLIRATKLAVQSGQIDAVLFDLNEYEEVAEAFGSGGRFEGDYAFEEFLRQHVREKPAEIMGDLRRRVLPKRAYITRVADLRPLAKMRLLRDDAVPQRLERQLAESVGIDESDVYVRVDVVDTKQYDPAGKG